MADEAPFIYDYVHTRAAQMDNLGSGLYVRDLVDNPARIILEATEPGEVEACLARLEEHAVFQNQIFLAIHLNMKAHMGTSLAKCAGYSSGMVDRICSEVERRQSHQALERASAKGLWTSLLHSKTKATSEVEFYLEHAEDITAAGVAGEGLSAETLVSMAPLTQRSSTGGPC